MRTSNEFQDGGRVIIQSGASRKWPGLSTLIVQDYSDETALVMMRKNELQELIRTLTNHLKEIDRQIYGPKHDEDHGKGHN